MDTVTLGDCREVLLRLPDECVDLIFADPPYNLQLRQELWRPNRTKVDGVDEAWDRFGGFREYDAFSRQWLAACRRVLKPAGTIWVIGTYHNIYRLGTILQDLGFWILNDVVWIKSNPMPNFRGVRLTNAHETLIWAAKSQGARYTFHHHLAKRFNSGKQLRSDWYLPICTGAERLRMDGRKLHPTQKPESLLRRILLISSKVGDTVLDPFFGTGTTGAAAKRLGRHWIGIENEPVYVQAARERIAAVEPLPLNELLALEQMGRSRLKVAVGELMQAGLLRPGQALLFDRDPARQATLMSDGRLQMGHAAGSIHQLGRLLSGGAPCNGWRHWYYADGGGLLRPIDDLRKAYRERRPPAEE